MLAAAIGTAVLAPAFSKPAGKDDKDYQAKADAMPWKFSDKAASATASAARLPKPYDADVNVNDVRRATIQLKRAGKALYDWEGHSETVFIVTGDVLYYTNHHPNASGCQLIAIDLESGKQMWKKDLKGLGPISHFRYRNQVNLDLEDGDTLRVFGRESAGGYVELVNRKSGNTIGNRRYKADEMKDK
jgi:hypothetical protein